MFLADVAPLGDWFVMIKVTPIGGHGAAGEAAGAGADCDRLGEPGGGVAAEFGGVEEPAVVVGEQPGEQHLSSAVRVEGFSDQVAQRLPGNEPGPVGKLGWAVGRAEQTGERYDDADTGFARPFDQCGCVTDRLVCHRVERFPDRFANSLTARADAL